MPHAPRNSASLVVICSALLLAACSGSNADTDSFVWEAWPEAASEDIPRPETPDPTFVRRDFVNLNGSWEFTFDPDDRGLNENWASGHTFDRTILVPYPWTSPLSGINENTGDTGGIGWYKRHVTLPAALAGRRVQLVIGAADWDVSLFVNGHEVVRHVASGYLPQRQDITDLLTSGDNEIVVRVQDPGNDPTYPHGKQGSPWYGNVGGIWQTVYLEAMPARHIASIALTPDLAAKRFAAALRVTGPAADCRVRAYAKGHESAPLLDQPMNGDTFSGVLDVPWLEAWSPENPVLQEFEWRLDCGGTRDAVRTYAGLRQVTRAKMAGQDYETVHLNGKPVYLRGVLVQGYNPQGLYTYPDTAAIVSDLTAAKNAGFNLVRLHIKTEEPRVLYEADRLGLLVDDDIPCYGEFPIESGDTAEARARWQALMEGEMRRDYNHPSIIWWTLFNEDWGLLSVSETYDAEKQAFVKSMLAEARTLDGSRLIEDHSTLRDDHVGGTDINSFHLYQERPDAFAASVATWVDGCYPGSAQNFVPGEKQDGAPLVNTEYGPFSVEYMSSLDVRDRDISWGFRQLTTLLRHEGKLVGYLFTELYDVEFELNGFLDYDRTAKDFGYPASITPADLNSADFVGFVEPSFQVAAGTAALTLHPFVSHYADADGVDGTLVATLYDTADTKLAETSLPFSAAPWAVTDLAAVTLPLPASLQGGAYVVAVWQGAAGARARSFLPGEVIAPKPAAVTCTATACEIALDLAACTGDADTGSVVRVDGEVQSLGFLGAGRLMCPVTIPAQVPGRSVSVRLEGEMAANVSGAPQTHQTGMTGGSLRIAFDTAAFPALALPPDRADSRGVLSQLNGETPKGGYGEWLSVATSTALTPSATAVLSFAVPSDDAHGFILYARRLGRFGRQPHLLIDWSAAR